MNKKLKQGLKAAFDPPQAVNKAEFLNNFAYPKASGFDFLISQISYIRKRVWLYSILLFAASLFALHYYTASLSVVWTVSSALPFLALITINEVTRSRFCGMAEIEASCKHSLSQVTLIRLMVLGTMNLLILMAILLSFIGKTDFILFRLGVYWLMPFLVSNYALLLIVNSFRGKEVMYVSAIVTGFISISNILITTELGVIFADKYVALWVAAFILFTIAIAMEIIKLIKRTEELECSLPSTA